jgi:hypothetical protein
MGDCACLTCRHTWEFRSVLRGLARAAFVPELLFLILPDDSTRLFVHGIVGVLFDYLENLCRTSDHAIAAAIAFVRIDGNEIIPGTVTVTVVSQHGLIPVSLVKRCEESVDPPHPSLSHQGRGSPDPPPLTGGVRGR